MTCVKNMNISMLTTYHTNIQDIQTQASFLGHYTLISVLQVASVCNFNVFFIVLSRFDTGLDGY